MLQAGSSRVRLPMGPLISFLSAPNLSSRTMATEFTQPVTKMSTGRLLGVKRGQCVRVTA
jgi:hypothetical protein